jgi:EAL domain-containing protein (putative c-di-GMP-specific phosphodiesterase class I)
MNLLGLHGHGTRSRRGRQAPIIDSVQIVLQPIIDISTGTVIACEALSRFASRDGSPTAEMFALAHASGRGAELEAACLRAALHRRHDLSDGVLLSVNVSPDALGHEGVQNALAGNLAGVIVEVTEHAATDSSLLHRLLEDVRCRGALIAVDDASTGYAGLLRLTTLRPDIVKLDRMLVAGAGNSVGQTAVIEALVSLCRRIGARVLAEGVETLADLTALAALDVDYAQGWVIAAPATVAPPVAPEAAAACLSARRALMREGSAPTAGSAADLHKITATLAGSVQVADLHATLIRASVSLGVDVIGLSTLTDDGRLTEVTAAGASVDAHPYPVAEFPATQFALITGTMVETHLDDPHSDAAERALLAEQKLASLLITPLIGNGAALGILEFSHRTRRRWTSHDINQARTLADHVTSVLLRLSPTVASTSDTETD